jgi:glutamate racemase
VIVNACTHFPLVEAELTVAAPRPVRLVDGGPESRGRSRSDPGAGMARREGVAVFTHLGEREAALRPGLAARGFSRIEAL